MERDTLNMTCIYVISDRYVSYPFLPASRFASLKERNREPPVRLTIEIESDPREVAVQLIKQSIHDWLSENRGSCLIIGGPGTHASDLAFLIFKIRCFGVTHTAVMLEVAIA